MPPSAAEPPMTACPNSPLAGVPPICSSSVLPEVSVRLPATLSVLPAPSVMSPLLVTVPVLIGRLSVAPAPSCSPEKLALVTLGSVVEPPVSVRLPAKVVQALATCRVGAVERDAHAAQARQLAIEQECCRRCR